MAKKKGETQKVVVIVKRKGEPDEVSVQKLGPQPELPQEPVQPLPRLKPRRLHFR